MIRSWWKQRRRKRWLSRLFSVSWTEILGGNVAYTRLLNRQEFATLCRLVQVFVPERNWEGCNGLEITDEIKVTIAGQACLLLLGYEGDYFDRLTSILVYPDTYFAEQTSTGPAGVVTQGHVPRLGEAWYRGPIVLAWTSVLSGGRIPDDGSNVVLHEFAHRLDMEGREIRGAPGLESFPDASTWHEVMLLEYQQFQQSVRQGRPTLLDHYAALDEREFFAVATEVFFERPAAMSHWHPRLYAALRGFYRQHPLERFQRTCTR